jgi:hypothetical protein
LGSEVEAIVFKVGAVIKKKDACHMVIRHRAGIQFAVERRVGRNGDTVFARNIETQFTAVGRRRTVKDGEGECVAGADDAGAVSGPSTMVTVPAACKGVLEIKAQVMKATRNAKKSIPARAKWMRRVMAKVEKRVVSSLLVGVALRGQEPGAYARERAHRQIESEKKLPLASV